MKTNENSVIYKEFFFLGFLFRWIDRHPRAASFLLWLQFLALAWFAFNYHFTTAL